MFTTFFVIVLSAPPAYACWPVPPAGQGADPGAPDLHPDGARPSSWPSRCCGSSRSVGLTDTVAALVIVNVAFWLPLIVWLLRNFFAEVPVSLETGARIDGCSRLGTLFRVTHPAAARRHRRGRDPDPDRHLERVPVRGHPGQPERRHDHPADHGHPELPRSPESAPPPNLLAAAAIVAVLPCLLLVLLFHRRIIAGLSEGFVKG